MLTDIGPWSEIKLEIIRNDAAAYSTILTKQPRISHQYIDAFAGSGTHRSKTTGEIIPRSPRVALETEPPFHRHPP